MPPRKLDVKPSTILSVLATLLLLYYYLRGLNFLSETFLLPVASQVISVGIHSFSTIIFSTLTRFTARRPLPLGAITPFLINLDTQVGGFLTPERLLIAPFVNLLLLHTPETLLGTLASGKPDIRSVGSTEEKVELGPFGGAFNKKAYYLSGQLLLSTTNPDIAYRQVAYPTSLGIVLPRKPVPWYQVFAQKLVRDNDAEKRIIVPNNEAAILLPVPTLPPSCNQKNISDFGFWLTMHHCGSYIGFSVGGNRRQTQGFFKFHRGLVTAKYASWKGERFVDGSLPSNMVPVPFPRVEKFWKSMKTCFLNSVSFNRPTAKVSLTEQLAISATVRIAGFDTSSGFSEPSALVDAFVTDVVNTNISRWVVATMMVAVVIDIVRIVLSAFKYELLAPELEPLVASLRDVGGLSSVARYERERRGWRRRVWAWFERDEHGGGRWIIPGGFTGEGKLDEDATSDTDTGSDRKNSDTE